MELITSVLALAPVTDPDPSYGVTDFAASLLSAANGSLLYIGAGVTAGVVIFAVTFGIRKGLAALRTVGK
jgi:hypothetical protein